MISEQINLDLISNMHKFNKNVKKVSEINYFLNKTEEDKSILLYLGYQDRFKTLYSLSSTISELYQYLGVDNNHYTFAVGIADNKIVTPIFLSYNTTLSSIQREEIEKKLNVSLIDIANNLVRLVPK